MIDLKWGKKISCFSETKRKHLLRFYGHGVMYRDHWKGEKRFFLKWDRKSFAICLPSVVPEGECIRWIFGWRLHEKIDFITNKPDPVLLEVHFYKLEVALYR